MANRYWVGLGLLPYNSIFSDPDNWSLTSGGSGGSSVPGVGDTAVFDDNLSTYVNYVHIDIVVECNFQFLMVSKECVIYINPGGYISLTEDFGSPLVFLNLIVEDGSKFFASNNYTITLKYLLLYMDNSKDGMIFNFGSSILRVAELEVWFMAEVGSFEQSNLAGTTITDIERLRVMNSGNFILGKVYIDFTSSVTKEFYLGVIDDYGTNLPMLMEEFHVFGDGTLYLCDVWWEDEYYKILNSGGLTLIGETPGGLNISVADEGYKYPELPPLFANFIMSSGIAIARNCTLIRNKASGGATFYALTNNGNIDSGNNTGWIFEISGSIILQSLPDVQLVKVGTTQQYLLSIVSSGGIIEDYITSDVTWSSSNENIATVSSSGLVTAISLGTVTITATYGEFSLSIGIRTTKDTRTIPTEPDRLSPHPYTYTATLGVSSRTGVK